MSTKTELSPTEKKLLNLVQREVPLVERPFDLLGEKAGMSGEEVRAALEEFKKQRIVRLICPIFDTRSLGYKSSLVAMKIPDEVKLAKAAEKINTHPGVTHNYRRNHDYNLWFTVAVSPLSEIGLERTIDLMHEEAGADVTRPMPTLKLFKIGVQLDVAGERKLTDSGQKPEYSEEDRKADSVTETDADVIRVFQNDLPLTERPFVEVAEKCGMTLEGLTDWVAEKKRLGQLRRISAVLNHRKAGFSSNAMGVWAVPEDRIDEVGLAMASFPAVSHCYRRPTYPDWPYTIFSMVHARTDEECEEILAAIREKTGVDEYAALYSSTEFKKTRLKYFTDEEKEWEAARR